MEYSLVIGILFIKLIDFDKCEFGCWYNNFKIDNEDLYSIIVKFDVFYCELYVMVRELLEL